MTRDHEPRLPCLDRYVLFSFHVPFSSFIRFQKDVSFSLDVNFYLPNNTSFSIEKKIKDTQYLALQRVIESHNKLCMLSRSTDH